MFFLTATSSAPEIDRAARALEAPALPAVSGIEEAVLTTAPEVPRCSPAIDRDYATTVVAELETIEKEIELASGVSYEAWTFGGTVPGPMIRVREGDQVELDVTNPAFGVCTRCVREGLRSEAAGTRGRRGLVGWFVPACCSRAAFLASFL